MDATSPTPLRNVPGWSDSEIRKLAESWITTAEQVVGAAATPEGLQALAEHLGVSKTRVQQLVALARNCLAPEDAARLAQPADTSQFGLGALGPPPDPSKPA
jgi:hypothetical protein